MSEDTRDFIMKDGEEAGKKPVSETKTAPQSTSMPKINFATFIVSLNHSALVHLGVVEDPTSGSKSKNLELAKQTIEIIAMLETKTKGNLTEEEAGMIKSLLYDLRMIYVKEKNT